MKKLVILLLLGLALPVYGHGVASAQLPSPPNYFLAASQGPPPICSCNGQTGTASASGACYAGWRTLGGMCSNDGQPCPTANYGTQNYNFSYTVPAGKCAPYVKFYVICNTPHSVPNCTDHLCADVSSPFDGTYIDHGVLTDCTNGNGDPGG